MDTRIEFSEGKYGLKAVIKSAWHPSFSGILLNREVQELELNAAKGWAGDNINFLMEFASLKSLIIIDMRLKNIEPIHELKALNTLKIITYAKTPIEFKNFPFLKSCDFEWIKGSESLFDSTTLINLSINRCKIKDSLMFSNLTDLEKLTLLNCDFESTEGLSTLHKLTYLSLANLKLLTSLAGINQLPSLLELEIQKCKNLRSITEIFEIKRLEKLLLIDMGPIQSIKGIEHLINLESFFFYDSTNVLDGDLSSLKSLQKLKHISFQNRKHYNLKREDFGKAYA